MIVFIATVLVAAIAAGVLISTSSDLQEKSSRTGSEATEQVASNLQVQSVVGKRTATTDDIEDLEIYVTLAPGATEVDLAQLEIQLSDGTQMVSLSHAAATSATEFAEGEIRDADGSFTTGTNPVMTAGDLIRIDIDAETALTTNGDIAERTDISIKLIPEVGSPVDIGFTTPNSYGTRLVMELA